jgi:hypothetical protein
MPRRSTIPIPNIPNVSRVGPAARMDPNAAAAPGRAATSMLQTGLGITAELIQRRDAAKQDAAWNRYETQRNIYKMEQDSKDKTAWSVFNENAKTSDPGDVMGLYDSMVKTREEERAQAFEQLKTFRGGLSKEGMQRMESDLQTIKAGEQIRKLAFEQDAVTVQDRRYFDVETSYIEYRLENLYGDENYPGVSEEISNLESRYREHYKSDADFLRKTGEMRQVAEYKKIQGMAQASISEEDINATEDYLNSRRGNLTSGQEVALESYISNAHSRRERIVDELDRAASNGKLDPEALLDAKDQNIISPEKVNELESSNETSKNKIFNEAQWKIDKVNIWDARLKADVKKKFSIGDIKYKDFKEVNEMIDKVSNPLSRSEIKRQVLAMWETAVGIDTNVWLRSRYVGERIRDYVPKERQEEAYSTLTGLGDDLTAFMEETDEDVDIYTHMTSYENGVANLYRRGTPSEEDIKKLKADVMAGVAVELVTKSIAKPFDPLKASPIPFVPLGDTKKGNAPSDNAQETIVDQEGDTAGNGSWIFKNGEWVPNE